MSIQSDVQELENLSQEIKRLSGLIKQLRIKEKEVKERIHKYLVENGLPGVRHHGMAILAETKTTRGGKKNKDREADALTVLEEYGITENKEEILKRILEARRGEEKSVTKIVTRQLKK